MLRPEAKVSAHNFYLDNPKPLAHNSTGILTVSNFLVILKVYQ